MSRRRWTTRLLTAAVRHNTTLAGTIRTLGLCPRGGNYQSIRAEIRKLKLSTTHWLGLAHLRGQKRMLPQRSLEQVLVEHSTYSRAALKKRLLKDGLLQNRCAVCGQGTTWYDKPLVLRLDHVNGVNDDCRLANLRMLCPNCDSQLPTFCGRQNLGKHRTVSSVCVDCGRSIDHHARRCVSCFAFSRRRVRRPSTSVLKAEVNKSSFVAVAKHYGVTDNTIRKWLRHID